MERVEKTVFTPLNVTNSHIYFQLPSTETVGRTRILKYLILFVKESFMCYKGKQIFLSISALIGVLRKAFKKIEEFIVVYKDFIYSI